MTSEMPHDSDSTGAGDGVHEISLFVGLLPVLSRFKAAVPVAGIFALTPGAQLLVLPFDEEVQDALHRMNGTGDWVETAPYLPSTRDLAFAAAISRAGPLAYLETRYRGAEGTQTAAVWIGGAVSIAPTTIDTATALSRPPPLWPVNAALRSVGVRATAPHDEFTTFGLRAWSSNGDIRAHARRIA